MHVLHNMNNPYGMVKGMIVRLFMRHKMYRTTSPGSYLCHEYLYICRTH